MRNAERRCETRGEVKVDAMFNAVVRTPLEKLMTTVRRQKPTPPMLQVIDEEEELHVDEKEEPVDEKGLGD